MSLSAVLITYNEEKNIRACLDSVRFADEIVIVDSGSSDATLTLAEPFKPRIFTRKFVDFSTQKNFALAQAKGDWVFLIDADERVTPELASELKRIASSTIDEAAYEVKRSSFFFKKPLHYSGTQTDAPIRLFPKGKVCYVQPVHERIVTDLPIRRLTNTLIHETTPDMDSYRRKLRQYIRLEVKTMLLFKRKAALGELLIRPAVKFIYLFFYRFGFLDGWTGLQFSALSAYYDYLKIRYYLRVMGRREE